MTNKKLISLPRGTADKTIKRIELYNYLMQILELETDCSVCSSMNWKCPLDFSFLDKEEEVSEAEEDKYYKSNECKCGRFIREKLEDLLGIGRITTIEAPLTEEGQKFYDRIIDEFTKQSCCFCSDLGWAENCPALDAFPSFGAFYDKEITEEEYFEQGRKAKQICRKHIKQKFAEILEDKKFL